MWKKILVKTTALISFIFLQVPVMAGQEGNGGGAFVCRSSSGGEIISAELVDMYEARSQLFLPVQERGSDPQEQLELVTARAYKAVDAMRAPKGFSSDLVKSLAKIRSIMRVVDNVDLESTDDFQIKVMPKSCSGGVVRFEQLAIYTPTNELIVNGDIYSKLSPTNKAALELHEALYLMAREAHGSETSLEARRAVGYLFSSIPVDKIPSGIFTLKPAGGSPKKRWVCKSSLLHHSCFDEGCQNGAEVNTYYGTSATEAFAALMVHAEKNEYQFMSCFRHSRTKVPYFPGQSGSQPYRYKCEETPSINNACYQQFI